MATIQGVYVALFGRPADPFGLEYWKGVTNDGANLSAIGDLAQTQEYQDRFAGQSNAQVVNSIFQSLFNRSADVAGLTYWVNGLNSGEFTINDVAIRILDGAQGSDKTTVDLKVEAADLFTASLDTSEEIIAYDGNDAAAEGRAFLAGVTTALPTQAEVDAAIETIVTDGNNPIGDTFTLTDKVGEIVNGTAANDTFIAVVGADATLNVGDQLDGKGGTDTLNLFVNGAGVNVPVSASIKNIEIVNLISSAALNVFDAGFKASAFAGATQVWQVNNVVDISDVGVNTTAGFRSATVDGVTVAASGASLAVAYDNVKGDAADNASALTVEGDTLSSVDLSGTMVKNAGVTDANSVELTFNAGKDVQALTLNTDFTTDLTLVQNGKDFTSFSAAESTGAVKTDLSAFTKLETVTLGSGNDVVTVVLGAKDKVVDLGAGNDTINVTSANADEVSLSITLGAGNDSVVVDAVANIHSATEDDFAGQIISITDFNGAADKLTIGSLGDKLVLDNLENAELAAKDNLFDAVTYVAEKLDNAGGETYAIFTFGGDTYVFNDADGDEAFSDGDGLIQLVGFTGELTAANFAVV